MSSSRLEEHILLLLYSMKTFYYYFTVFIIIGTTSAAIVLKRRSSNSYGDELVAPAGGGAPVTVNVVPEQPSTRIHQGYSTYSAGVQTSGYRLKRAGGNSYGDEQVMPAGESAQEAYRPAVEQASAQVQQYSVKNEAAVVSSGYR